MALTTNLGYPRIGPDRELKRATEAYWKGEIGGDELLATGARLRRENWETQRAAGIDLIPCNDFSYYDHVLDTVALIGAVPARYGWKGGAKMSTWTPTSRWRVARSARDSTSAPWR